MPEDQSLDDDLDEPRGLRKQLEEQAAARRESDARAAAAERELAFAKAGIDLTDDRTGYFVRGYTGEVTPEAIREEAQKAGFLAPAAPAVPPGELQAHQQAAALAAGADPVSTFTGNQWESPEAKQAYAEARTPAEVQAVIDKFGSPTLATWE